MRSAFDWIGRTAVLALSVIATLTMMSSLASISGGPIGGLMPRSGEMIPAGTAAEAPPVPPQINENATDNGALAANVSDLRSPEVTAPRSSRDEEQTRWLKALTYAVQALAIVAAVGVIVLLRLAALLSRIANR